MKKSQQRPPLDPFCCCFIFGGAHFLSFPTKSQITPTSREHHSSACVCQVFRLYHETAGSFQDGKAAKKVPATFLSSLRSERAALSSSTAKSSGNSWPPSNETAWVGRKMCWGISIESFNIRQEQSNRILALKGNSGIIGWDGWVGINHWSSLYGVSPAVYEMEAHASSYFYFFYFFTTQILLLLHSTLFSTCSVT